MRTQVPTLIFITLTQATNLDTAAGYLEDDIRYAGSLFDTYCAECVACDNHFAGEFTRLAGEVRQLTGRIQAIRDSFCPVVGITDWGTMFEIKAGMSPADQAALMEVMVDALFAAMMPGNPPNWEPNWVLIEAMLGKPYEQWTDAMGVALSMVYVSFLFAEDTEGLTQFINAMATPVGVFTDISFIPADLEGILSPDAVMWAFCPNKIGNIQQHIEGAISHILARQIEMGDDHPLYPVYTQQFLTLAQGSATLSVVGGLTPVTWSAPSGPGQWSMQASQQIVAIGDVNGPGLVLEPFNGPHHSGIQVSVQTIPWVVNAGSQASSMIPSAGPGNSVHVGNLQNSNIIISQGLYPQYVGNVAQMNAVQFWGDQNAGGAIAVFADGLVEFGASQIISTLPVVDGAISFVQGAAGVINNTAQHQQQVNNVTATLDNWGDGNLCNNLHLNGVVVFDGSANQQIFKWPTSTTPGQLDHYGLTWDSVVDDPNGAHGQITRRGTGVEQP